MERFQFIDGTHIPAIEVAVSESERAEIVCLLANAVIAPGVPDVPDNPYDGKRQFFQIGDQSQVTILSIFLGSKHTGTHFQYGGIARVEHLAVSDSYDELAFCAYGISLRNDPGSEPTVEITFDAYDASRLMEIDSVAAQSMAVAHSRVDKMSAALKRTQAIREFYTERDKCGLGPRQATTSEVRELATLLRQVDPRQARPQSPLFPDDLGRPLMAKQY